MRREPGGGGAGVRTQPAAGPATWEDALGKAELAADRAAEVQRRADQIVGRGEDRRGQLTGRVFRDAGQREGRVEVAVPRMGDGGGAHAVASADRLQLGQQLGQAGLRRAIPERVVGRDGAVHGTSRRVRLTAGRQRSAAGGSVPAGGRLLGTVLRVRGPVLCIVRAHAVVVV